MNTNMGKTDRIVRVIVGLALVVAPLLDFMGTGSNTIVAYGMLAVGVVLAITGLVGVCPIYRMLGIRTTKP